jgi:hypothetical protein
MDLTKNPGMDTEENLHDLREVFPHRRQVTATWQEDAEIWSWCRSQLDPTTWANTRNQRGIQGTFTATYWFANEEDAALFTLTWS